MKGHTFSIISGFLAAIASLCGKYAMSFSEALHLCENAIGISEEVISGFINTKDVCIHHLTGFRIFFFLLMFGVNCIMWTIFTKALRFSSTSLEATIINTASNFLFTAVVGQVLFDEFLTGFWWMGTVLIIFGLFIIHQSKRGITTKRTHLKFQ